MYYFTSIDGTPETRASHLFKSEMSAKTKAMDQNVRAESLGIKARYVVGSGEFPGVSPADVRD